MLEKQVSHDENISYIVILIYIVAGTVHPMPHILSSIRGGNRLLPHAFASVLNHNYVPNLLSRSASI